ncbi:hypothetical protein BDR26DRAFT_917435 [Obelidium mucronatum]|nr:hypothetical protein BDR26DRAFT_917435 [Obelidium mucronatum]
MFEIEGWLAANASKPKTALREDQSTVGAVSVIGFGNLALLDEWSKDTGIDLDASFSQWTTHSGVTALLGETPETFRTLSKRQNASWAHKMVIEGIACSQEKQLEKAITKYTRALEIDPECVDALVARGAAFANQGHFSKAIDDHSNALKIQPTHENAHRYLQKCIARKREIEAEKQSAADGAFLMPVDYAMPRGKIPLTRSLMNANPYATAPSKNPPAPPHVLGSQYSSSSLASSIPASTNEEFGFVFEEDTVAPPPPSSGSKKRKKESKRSGTKKKSKKSKKKSSKDSRKRRSHSDDRSSDSESRSDSD